MPPAIEVHCIDLDGSASDADRDLATRDELERAARFRNGTDARRFLARRAAARRLIGLRLGVSPRRIATSPADIFRGGSGRRALSPVSAGRSVA